MRQSLFAALLAGAVLAGGCGSGQQYLGGGSDILPLDSPAGLRQYLLRQNLPPVESIETWDNKYGPGLVITTRNYQIYTTLLEPLMLQQVPGFVESAYRGYQAQLPRPVETQSKFTVYLFGQRQHWEDFTKDFTGPQAAVYLKIKKGGYYLNGACVVYNIGRERTFAVLGHEGWHQFNSRHFYYRLPSWVDEGIAMLFETSQYQQGWFLFQPYKNLGRLGALRETLLQNRIIPLRELITLNPGQVLVADDADAVMAFYAQSYALVRFLREDNYGKRLQDFHQLLLEGLAGGWPLAETEKRIAADRNIPLTAGWNEKVSTMLFKNYITEDVEGIEKEYLAFCRKIVYRVRLLE
jgi:hypothetical protein